MTTILVSDDTLTVRLEPVSKLAGLLRDQVISRSAVTGVEVVTDGLAAARGVRRFVDVRRGQPALRLSLQCQHYDELLIGHDDAAGIAERLAPV
jgi:hypothetical protein